MKQIDLRSFVCCLVWFTGSFVHSVYVVCIFRFKGRVGGGKLSHPVGVETGSSVRVHAMDLLIHASAFSLGL